MARATSKSESARQSEKVFPSVETFASVWPMTGAGISAPTVVDSFRKMSELQMDVARFAAETARKNASTLAAFATCRSPMDFLETWRRSALEVVTDYADEAARILDRAQK